MKITNQSNNAKKTIVVILAVICVAVIAFGIYWYLSHSNKPTSNKVNLNPPTKEETQAGTSVKEQTVEKDQAAKNGDNSSNSGASTNRSLSVDITASNKTSSLMQIRVQINSIINSGRCDITLKNGSSSVHHTTDISPLASTSTCNGFDIPLSELSPGNWSYTITVTEPSTNQTGSINGTFSV